MNSGMEGIPAIHGREEVKELLTITDGHCSVTSSTRRCPTRGHCVPGRPRRLAEHRRGPIELARTPRPLPSAPTIAPRSGPVPRRTERLAGHRSGLNYTRAFHGHLEQKMIRELTL